MFIVKDLT